MHSKRVPWPWKCRPLFGIGKERTGLQEQLKIKMRNAHIVLICNYLQLRISKVNNFGSNLTTSKSNKRLIDRWKCNRTKTARASRCSDYCICNFLYKFCSHFCDNKTYLFWPFLLRRISTICKKPPSWQVAMIFPWSFWGWTERPQKTP